MAKQIKLKWYSANIPKIRGLLAEHGFTQKDLAVWLGCTERSVQNKMNGVTLFKEREIKIIMDTFDVHGDLIANGW